MFFDLENLLEKTSNFMKYSLEPYPPYFQAYDWKSAEKEVDEAINSENVIISNSVTEIQKDLAKLLK